MKNIIVVILVTFFSLNVFAQDENTETKHGFKKDHLFTGGGLQLSFSNYTFIGGANPVFGYSFNKLFDAGIGVNFTYASNRHVIYQYVSQGVPTGEYLISDDKAKQTIAGPLAFAKFYPVKFLFIQGQGEANFISQKTIYADGGPIERHHYTVPSLLLGAGYCSGRENVGDFFYYLSVSLDVLKRKNSPYVEEISNGHINILPVIRAGLQIPLFQGRRR